MQATPKAILGIYFTAGLGNCNVSNKPHMFNFIFYFHNFAYMQYLVINTFVYTKHIFIICGILHFPLSFIIFCKSVQVTQKSQPYISQNDLSHIIGGAQNFYNCNDLVICSYMYCTRHSNHHD